MISSLRSTQVAQVASLEATASGSVRAGQSAADASSLSGPAELFKKLQALAKSDPAKFKQATQAISDALQTEASQSTDPHEQQMLSNLSAKFAEAAKTGDASGLAPPKGPPPGGRPPPPPTSSSSGGGGTKVYDPADSNQDGTVTQAEQAAYDAKEAAAKASATSASQAYGQQMHAVADQKGQALFANLNEIVDAALA